MLRHSQIPMLLELGKMLDDIIATYTVQGQGHGPLALGPTLTRPSRVRVGPDF
jgi:hypothetical protein